MKFVIEINCNNDAFIGDPMREVVKILKNQATKLEKWTGDAEPIWRDSLRDDNGNKVGYAAFVKDES